MDILISDGYFVRKKVLDGLAAGKHYACADGKSEAVIVELKKVHDKFQWSGCLYYPTVEDENNKWCNWVGIAANWNLDGRYADRSDCNGYDLTHIFSRETTNNFTNYYTGRIPCNSYNNPCKTMTNCAVLRTVCSPEDILTIPM